MVKKLDSVPVSHAHVYMDDFIHDSSSINWQGESLTEILLDRLNPVGERKYAINRQGQLQHSGLYIVSFLADGKPKRHYKMGRAKYIGKRLTSYKTYHPEEHAIRLHACICIPLTVQLAKRSKYNDDTHLFKETTLDTGSLVVLFESMCKHNLIARPQTVQIRNTEWMGKGKGNSTMAYNLGLFKQIWLKIGNALPKAQVSLYVFNKRLFLSTNVFW